MDSRINKKELAKRIDVSVVTIYNWEKTKPELIKMIENSYRYENGESEAAEFLKYFYELDQDEQELYIAEIKFKALKKKKDKNS